MKKLLLFLLIPAAACVALLSSCSHDDDNSLDKFWIDIATADNPNQSSAFNFILDSKDTLWIAATNIPYYRPASGKRAIINYTRLQQTTDHKYLIKLNDAEDVLTKPVFNNMNAAAEDSIGHDPIDMSEGDSWVGGDYMNVRFAIQAGFNGTKHMINLVRYPDKTYPDGKIHLILRHNANGDQGSYQGIGIASFNLTNLKPLAQGKKSLDMVIDYTAYDGKLHSMNVTYNFDATSAQHKAELIPSNESKQKSFF